MQLDRPVFVIGHPRSGTTVLRLALTSHSAVSIPPESPFIIQLLRKYRSIKSFSSADLQQFHQDLLPPPVDLSGRWDLDVDELQRQICEIPNSDYGTVCSHIYAHYAATFDTNATIWGDKNNPYHRHVFALKNLYPKARFIHIVRDGRAILGSYLDLSTRLSSQAQSRPRLLTDPIKAAANWCHSVTTVEKQLLGVPKNQRIFIRYEDLVSNFEEEMVRICKFLNLEYESDMLRFDKIDSNRTESSNYDEWKWRTKEQLTSSRISAWRDQISERDHGIYNAIAGNTLRKLGYSTNTQPKVPTGILAKYKLEIGSLAVSQRVRDWMYR